MHRKEKANRTNESSILQSERRISHGAHFNIRRETIMTDELLLSLIDEQKRTVKNGRIILVVRNGIISQVLGIDNVRYAERGDLKIT